jgi:hypothetical protein
MSRLQLPRDLSASLYGTSSPRTHSATEQPFVADAAAYSRRRGNCHARARDRVVRPPRDPAAAHCTFARKMANAGYGLAFERPSPAAVVAAYPWVSLYSLRFTLSTPHAVPRAHNDRGQSGNLRFPITI